jgi:hypothetical protein
MKLLKRLLDSERAEHRQPRAGLGTFSSEVETGSPQKML